MIGGKSRRRRPAGSAVLAATGALLAIAACAGGAAGVPEAQRSPTAAALQGKVTRRGEGVAGARVFAYRSFEDFLAQRPGAASGPTGPGGGYRLALPEGTYYLAARKPAAADDGPLPAGGLACFHGSNPFTLAAGSATQVDFSLTRAAAPAVEPGADPASGSLGGIVLLEDRPLPGATVKLFLDAETDFRGAGYASSPPTDERGAFRFDYLPESDYFVVARRRAAGPGAGPLAEGDAYGYLPANPVAVRSGTSVSVELEMLTKGREAGNADSRPRPGGTHITGRITDAAGAVVPGVYAFAYEEKVMSHKKPAFLSAAVDEQGRYVLHLSGGGTYYLGARSAYGDSPAKGEWYGRYEGTPDHGVRVATGEGLEGIDLVVERILLP